MIEHVCYYLLVYVARGKAMKLLRLAIESERWDLAAHTIVFATVSLLKNGEKPDVSKSRQKKRRPKRQPER